jgi:HK97 family phage portal protein
MLNGIRSLIAGTKESTTLPANVRNYLFEILYSYAINNSLAVLLDGKQETFLKKGYQGNAMVYACIRKIAEKSKNAPLVAYKEKSEKRRYKAFKYSSDEHSRVLSRVYRAKELDYSTDKELLKLLKRPNKWQTMPDFLDMSTAMYETFGNLYWYKVAPDVGANKGKPYELHILPSNLVEIEFSGNHLDPIKAYKLRIGSGEIIPIPAENVYHIKFPNLNFTSTQSQLYGQPPLLAALDYLTNSDSAIKALIKAVQNEGAKGIVSPDVQDPKFFLTPQQKEALDQRLDKDINSTDNRGRVISAAMPVKYSAIGLSPVALEIINQLNLDDEKICAVFGLNPVLFKPNATNANLEYAQKGLVLDVVLPLLSTYESAMNEFISPYFGQGITIDFDTTVFSELQPDLELINKVYGNNPAFTWNELRELLNWDRSEAPEADLHWIPNSLIPASEQVLPDTEKDFSDYK